MMLVLVPAPEVGVLGGAFDLDQSDDLGVVGEPEFEIGHANIGVRETQDSRHQVCTVRKRPLSLPS